MKIPINLASQPFRRDRAMLAASVAVSAVLMLTLAGLIYLAFVDRAQSAELRRELLRLDGQISRATAQQAQLDAVLRKPENSNVLYDSVFINTLLQHKGISWSKLFADLENTIPYNVKLMSLVPSINSQNKVVLDIIVAAEKSEAIIECAAALEKTSVFHSMDISTEQYPTQAEPFYRGRITVNYAQKL